jgi:hypothetical protein
MVSCGSTLCADGATALPSANEVIQKYSNECADREDLPNILSVLNVVEATYNKERKLTQGSREASRLSNNFTGRAVAGER